jgi:hypothetical protein
MLVSFKNITCGTRTAYISETLSLPRILASDCSSDIFKPFCNTKELATLATLCQ